MMTTTTLTESERKLVGRGKIAAAVRAIAARLSISVDDARRAVDYHLYPAGL